MKQPDPLFLLTCIVGLCLVAVLGRYVVTGEISEALLGVLSTIIGGLITALTTRKKTEKEGKDDDGTQ